IFCQKYGGSGTAGFLDPLELELSDNPVKLINAVAASDQGIIILYALEADNEQVDMKLQKIDALGQALWANAGCTVASQVDIKQPATKICANSIGGAYVLHEGEYTTQGNIISGMNLDACGTNIWTAPQESIYPDVYAVKQLLLADNGNLIFCLTGYQKQSFHQVDANGNVLGSNPLFSLTDPIPTNAAMLKSVDGSIMLYTNDAYNLNALGLQLLDANLAPVFSSVKEIPLNIYAQAITAERLVDGGFMLSYHYEISAQEDQHTLKTHRLDSNLDELWASGAAEIPVSGNTLFMLDTATDMASNLWLTACVVDSEYYNGRVLIAKLDENGNTIFLHQAVSSEIQPKSYPKLSVYGDSAMLNWGEHDGDNIMMKRQIFDAQGNELLQDNG
ncbi:MAG TPA: hypothetical protein P5342_06950, partial [Candidatus Cloacimonadota bacterium]|nr:hypothetical protein [Candidatus Cloacimonadota bacterium]